MTFFNCSTHNTCWLHLLQCAIENLVDNMRVMYNWDYGLCFLLVQENWYTGVGEELTCIIEVVNYCILFDQLSNHNAQSCLTVTVGHNNLRAGLYFMILTFAVWQSTMKTVKIGQHESFLLHGICKMNVRFSLSRAFQLDCLGAILKSNSHRLWYICMIKWFWDTCKLDLNSHRYVNLCVHSTQLKL